MSRNDNLLGLGMSSAAARQAKQAKEEVTKLPPKGDEVLTEIAKMKSAVVSIEHVITDPSITEEAKLKQIEAIKIKYDILNELERRMKRILGVKS